METNETMTPDDVARDCKTLEHWLCDEADEKGFKQAAAVRREVLSRLATAAARVTGLEEDNQGLLARQAELTRARDKWAGKVAEEKEKRMAAEARATAAEAKVAELQSEVDRLNNRLGDLYAEHVTAPTPASGLREAVGPLVPILWEALARESSGMLAFYSPASEVRAILAAYDATPEPSVTHADLAAVVDDMPPEHAPEPGHEDCPDNPCPGHHPYCEGVGRDEPPPGWAESPRVAEWGEKAAKWDAAVGRTADEDAAACALLGIPTFKGSGMPPSHKASWRIKAQTFARWLLGLTLPTGPGGGSKCSLCKDDPDAQCPECGPAPVPVSEALESRHPRMTPEGATLRPDGRTSLEAGYIRSGETTPLASDTFSQAFSQGVLQAIEEARTGVRLPDVAFIGPGSELVASMRDAYGDLHRQLAAQRAEMAAIRAKAEDEPAAPEVVAQWGDEKGNAFNVSINGAMHSHGDMEVIADALARMLAEARRDNEAAKTILTRAARQMEQDAARKAAEDMRERAVDAAWDASGGLPNFHRAEIRDAIRALPLK